MAGAPLGRPCRDAAGPNGPAARRTVEFPGDADAERIVLVAGEGEARAHRKRRIAPDPVHDRAADRIFAAEGGTVDHVAGLAGFRRHRRLADGNGGCDTLAGVAAVDVAQVVERVDAGGEAGHSGLQCADLARLGGRGTLERLDRRNDRRVAAERAVCVNRCNAHRAGLGGGACRDVADANRASGAAQRHLVGRGGGGVEADRGGAGLGGIGLMACRKRGCAGCPRFPAECLSAAA